MIDHAVVGKIGRVTGGLISPGRLGEVMISVRGGTEAYNAYCDGDEPIPQGARVVVVEYLPPRTVVVSPSGF